MLWVKSSLKLLVVVQAFVENVTTMETSFVLAFSHPKVVNPVNSVLTMNGPSHNLGWSIFYD
ncbi:MAG: hypothetical protein AAGH46_02505 [Bacteroidota bacterium]